MVTYEEEAEGGEGEAGEEEEVEEDEEGAPEEPAPGNSIVVARWSLPVVVVTWFGSFHKKGNMNEL